MIRLEAGIGVLRGRQQAFLESRILEIAGFLRPDRRNAGDHDDLVVGRKLHHLAGGKQRSRGLGARDHEMRQPGSEAMTGVVLHGPHLGRCAERVRHALGGPLVVGREAHADMAVVEHAVVGAVCLLDLVERLRDQERLDAVAGHEGERALEEVEPPQSGELVEHHQDAVATILGMQVLGQAARRRGS